MTERESWILGNQDENPELSVEKNAAMIEPGLEKATGSVSRTEVAKKWTMTSTQIYHTHGKGKWK